MAKDFVIAKNDINDVWIDSKKIPTRGMK